MPDYPYDIFLQSHADMKLLLDQNIKSDDEQILQRMVFTQSISAMEAYLCDTLINSVFENEEAINKILSSCEPFRKKSLNLAEVASIKIDLNDFVNNHMRNTLKREIYHRIDAVKKLYKKGLGVKLIDIDEDQETLKIAIGHRHDCVHRNGFKKDKDEKNKVFTTEYVKSTMDLIKKIIDELEEKISSKTESLPF